MDFYEVGEGGVMLQIEGVVVSVFVLGLVGLLCIYFCELMFDGDVWLQVFVVLFGCVLCSKFLK